MTSRFANLPGYIRGVMWEIRERRQISSPHRREFSLWCEVSNWKQILRAKPDHSYEGTTR